MPDDWQNNEECDAFASAVERLWGVVRDACVYPQQRAAINKNICLYIYLSDCIQEIIAPFIIISNHELTALNFMKYIIFGLL